jgi:hypothetical protein
MIRFVVSIVGKLWKILIRVRSIQLISNVNVVKNMHIKDEENIHIHGVRE